MSKRNKCLFAALCVVAGCVFAATVLAAPVQLSISWTIPPTKADCSPLPISSIAGYRIYIADMMNGKVLQIGVSGGAQTSYKVTVDDAGWYLLFMRTINKDNSVSIPSAVLQYDGGTTTLVIPPKIQSC